MQEGIERKRKSLSGGSSTEEPDSSTPSTSAKRSVEDIVNEIVHKLFLFMDQ